MNYDPKPNTPCGINPVLCWGHNRIPKSKGIITYSLSSNRLNPLAGAAHNAVFNTARRCWGQVFYVVPPFLVAWWLVGWAERRNEFENSKEGRRLQMLRVVGDGRENVDEL